MKHVWIVYWHKEGKVTTPAIVCGNENAAIEAAEEHYGLESIDWTQVYPWRWEEKGGAVVERFPVRQGEKP